MKKIYETIVMATGSNSRAFSGMRRRISIFSVFFLGFLFSASVQAATLSDNAGLTMELGTNGSVSGVTLNGSSLPAGTGGGFYLMEPNSSTKVPLTGSVVSNAGNFYLTLTNSLQAKVTATLTQGAGFIEVEGVLEDLTGTDRGLWLGFNVPVDTTGWKWGHNLVGANQVISSGAPGYSGDDRFLIPIPAVWTNTGGIALCIPPTEPCVFENSADAGGVRIRMAFGLSPITTNFPSKAVFCFRIYSIDGTWGFRDALAKFYDWYPDYYTIEPMAMKRLNHRRDWLTMNYEDEGPSANDQASIASPELGEWCAYTKITARPQGMTGVDLTTISPTNTQAYLNAIAACTDILHYGRKVSVNNSKLVEARAAISNCAVYHPDGTWSMEMAPAIDSLDIGHNVSPNLFNDAAHTNWSVYADMYLRRPGKLIGFEPKFTFMHWDRLGGRSAIVNYRREHFAYTAHPLTFDQLGRLCLPTQFSNYELFDAFRLQFKQGGMFHEGAGMKDFGVKHADEMPGGQDRVGLFFLSSVLASAWTEGGEKYHALGEYDSFRIFMGRKSYRIACDEIPTMVAAGQTNEALATVKRALANATAYGFASVIWDAYFYPTNHPRYNPATGSLFYTPAHQALWTNYIPASEAIRLAGWEPVTHAFASSAAVEVQRFGRGTNIYLTVLGPTNLPASVDIDIEAAALGLSTNPAFSEIVANTPMTIVPSARGWKLTVPMAQDMTRVIKIHSSSSGVTLYPLTVNSGSGSGSYTNGQQVAISASNLIGKAFAQWIGDTQYVNNLTYTNALVTMSTNAVTLTATYTDIPGRYTLTVNSGTGSGSYTNGQQVAISASNLTGKAFVQWIGDTQYVNNVTYTNALVTMSTNAVTLTATYVDVYYALTVNSGSGSGSYTNGQQVAITANVIAGKTFSAWTGNTQFVAGVSASTTTVTMPAQAIALTATYVDAVSATIAVVDSTGGVTSLGVTNISKVFPTTGGNVLVVNLSYKGVNSTYPTGPLTLDWVTGSGTVTQTMTRAVQAGNNAPKAFGSSIYYLWNPTAGSGTISGSLPAGYQAQIISALTLSGVDTNVSPIIASAINDTQTSSSITSSTATGVPTGGFAALCSGSAATATGTGFSASASGGTPVNWLTNNVGGGYWYQGYIPNLAGGNTTFSCTHGSAARLHIVAAVFSPGVSASPVTYTLTASAGANGAVSPTNASVLAGDSTNFVITANNYYRIASLSTNGTAVTGMSFDNDSTAASFTWSNVQTSGVLAATFTAQVVTNAPAQVPYSWLADYGLTNYDTDANADQDSDGLKAWQEYIAGTLPNSATSCFTAAQNTRNMITWSPVSGRVYSVYWSTNLVKGFQPLETNIPWTQGSYTNATPDSRVNHYQIKVRMQ